MIIDVRGQHECLEISVDRKRGTEAAWDEGTVAVDPLQNGDAVVIFSHTAEREPRTEERTLRFTHTEEPAEQQSMLPRAGAEDDPVRAFITPGAQDYDVDVVVPQEAVWTLRFKGKQDLDTFRAQVRACAHVSGRPTPRRSDHSVATATRAHVAQREKGSAFSAQATQEHETHSSSVSTAEAENERAHVHAQHEAEEEAGLHNGAIEYLSQDLGSTFCE